MLLFSHVSLNNATMVNYSLYGLHVHTDRYEGHSFYLRWCFCGLGENYIREVLALPHFNMLSGVSSQSSSKVFLRLCFTQKNRRQDSSIGFGAPVRANMRAGGVSSAQVTSSLLESVSTALLLGLDDFLSQKCSNASPFFRLKVAT